PIHGVPRAHVSESIVWRLAFHLAYCKASPWSFASEKWCRARRERSSAPHTCARSFGGQSISDAHGARVRRPSDSLSPGCPIVRQSRPEGTPYNYGIADDSAPWHLPCYNPRRWHRTQREIRMTGHATAVVALFALLSLWRIGLAQAGPADDADFAARCA